jgi:hypothetical protein
MFAGVKLRSRNREGAADSPNKPAGEAEVRCLGEE